jgi:hypothetical protein
LHPITAVVFIESAAMPERVFLLAELIGVAMCCVSDVTAAGRRVGSQGPAPGGLTLHPVPRGVRLRILASC